MPTDQPADPWRLRFAAARCPLAPPTAVTRRAGRASQCAAAARDGDAGKNSSPTTAPGCARANRGQAGPRTTTAEASDEPLPEHACKRPDRRGVHATSNRSAQRVHLHITLGGRALEDHVEEYSLVLIDAPQEYRCNSRWRTWAIAGEVLDDGCR